jgi:hypothetical protein
MEAEPLCVLRDCTLPFRTAAGLVLPPVPGPVCSVPEVVDYLRAAAAKPPHMVRMDLPGRVRGWVAIGGPWGTVYVDHLLPDAGEPEDVPPAWHALAARPPAVGAITFLTCQDPIEVEPEHLLPADEVAEIAAHLAAHRTLARTHQWLAHDHRGTPLLAGRDRPWEDWDKPLPRPLVMPPIDAEPGAAADGGGM